MISLRWFACMFVAASSKKQVTRLPLCVLHASVLVLCQQGMWCALATSAAGKEDKAGDDDEVADDEGEDEESESEGEWC